MNEQDTVEESRRVLRRRSAQERERLISEYRASGKTEADFCREQQVNLATFKGWLNRETLFRQTPFAEVTLAMPETAAVEVVFPGGVKVNIRRVGSRDDLVVTDQNLTVRDSRIIPVQNGMDS